MCGAGRKLKPRYTMDPGRMPSSVITSRRYSVKQNYVPGNLGLTGPTTTLSYVMLTSHNFVKGIIGSTLVQSGPLIRDLPY